MLFHSEEGEAISMGYCPELSNGQKNAIRNVIGYKAASFPPRLGVA